MGCFSFICYEADEPVNSSSFDGDVVHMFFIEDGKVVEHMYGNYDSYGRVFDGKGGSFLWSDWDRMVDLHFSPDPYSGIAVVLDEYYKGEFPTSKSFTDPDQGWNEMKYNTPCKNPFYKVY